MSSVCQPLRGGAPPPAPALCARAGGARSPYGLTYANICFIIVVSPVPYDTVISLVLGRTVSRSLVQNYRPHKAHYCTKSLLGATFLYCCQYVRAQIFTDKSIKIRHLVKWCCQYYTRSHPPPLLVFAPSAGHGQRVKGDGSRLRRSASELTLTLWL